MFTAAVTLTVPFHDVDIMMIAWHGHYAKYCELARTALTQALGIDWPVIKSLGYVMPIVHFSCDYRVPLEYGEEYEVVARAVDLFLPAFEVQYEVRSSASGKCHAWGKTRQVYVCVESKEISFSLPPVIDSLLRARLEGKSEPEVNPTRAKVFWR